MTDEMYQTLCAIEYVVRAYFHGDAIPACNSDVIVEAAVDDTDVQFYWNLASSEHTSGMLLDKIAKQWLAIRQHSFAKSILEKYKSETKQPIQKKKSLRSTLLTNGGISSDSD